MIPQSPTDPEALAPSRGCLTGLAIAMLLFWGPVAFLILHCWR
jgi:hypothetical protein